MNKIALIILFLLVGCSGQSSQIVKFTPVASACVKSSAWNLTSAATSFICFDKDEKVIGMVSGTAQSPLDIATGYANAAVLGAAIPLTAGLLMPAVSVSTAKP